MLEDTPAFRDALVKAAADAQLSPASWAKATLAKALNVEIPAAEKRAADPVAKAVLAADKRLLELVLIRDHYGRIAETEPIIKPMHVKATATVTSYVKKLAETVGQEKADAILKATEEKVAATRK
jgi:phage terminase large subunit-like protein